MLKRGNDMIECPKCKALNYDDSLVCGNCGYDISKVKRKQKIKSNGEVHLKNDKEAINKFIAEEYKKKEEEKAKKEGIVLFIVSLLCWLLIPIPGVKFFLSILILGLVNFSESKDSVLLTLTNIICILQIVGVIVLFIIDLVNR